MATIRAAWKRSVRVREYETETLELMVEKTVEAPGINLVEESVALDRALALAGDALVVERLAARVAEAPNASGPVFKTAGRTARSSPPQAPDEADPLV